MMNPTIVLSIVVLILAMGAMLLIVVGVVLFFVALSVLFSGHFHLGAKLALTASGAVLGAYICASAAVGVEEILFWRKRRRQ